jgi:hypothetical protein
VAVAYVRVSSGGFKNVRPLGDALLDDDRSVPRRFELIKVLVLERSGLHRLPEGMRERLIDAVAAEVGPEAPDRLGVVRHDCPRHIESEAPCLRKLQRFTSGSRLYLRLVNDRNPGPIEQPAQKAPGLPDAVAPDRCVADRPVDPRRARPYGPSS